MRKIAKVDEPEMTSVYRSGLTNGVSNRLARLRGSLAAEEPGARGLERVARNPGCQRLRALTMAGLAPATVLSRVYGEQPREGQSPFAIAAGNRFESRHFENGAARLLELYQRANRLRPSENRVVNVPEREPRVNAAALERRRELSEALLRQKLAGDPAAPNIIVKPRIAVRLLGVDHIVEPDALVASDSDAFFRPIEVKSYPDRRGKTDPADVRGACRQAAVGVIALRQALAALGILDPSTLVLTNSDLVLRVPGSYGARLTSMTVRGEVDSVERAIAAAPRDLDELESLLAAINPGATLSDPNVLDQIPNRYLESCREHCALADRCRQQAREAGDPILLGGFAREELAPAGSVDRALALLDGAAPQSPAEGQLQRVLREALGEYEAALR